MKRLLGKRFAVLLVLAFVGLTGCAQQGIVPGPGPGPVPPTEWISGSTLWEEINGRITNQYAIIALEKTGYNTVSVERINNAAAELVLDPNWGPLTAAEAFIVTLRRADPQAAVGLILIGPLDCAHYRVITADLVNQQIVIRLVDPIGRNIEDWNFCTQAGFVAM